LEQNVADESGQPQRTRGIVYVGAAVLAVALFWTVSLIGLLVLWYQHPLTSFSASDDQLLRSEYPSSLDDKARQVALQSQFELLAYIVVPVLFGMLGFSLFILWRVFRAILWALSTLIICLREKSYAVFLFAFLTQLLPERIRAECAEDMVEHFRTEWQGCRKGSGVWLVHELADLSARVIGEHLRSLGVRRHFDRPG
jgi:hypothetical protein